MVTAVLLNRTSERGISNFVDCELHSYILSIKVFKLHESMNEYPEND